MSKRKHHHKPRKAQRRGRGRSVSSRRPSTTRRRRRHHDRVPAAVASPRRCRRARTAARGASGRQVIRGERMGFALRLEYRDAHGQRRYHNFPAHTPLGHVGRKFLAIPARIQEFVV